MIKQNIANRPYKYIHVFKGKFVHSNNSMETNKVIVFDLDETIGSFADLKLLWDMYLPQMQTIENFIQLFNLYPEFLRYGILNILEYLYHKKRHGECSKILLYTNNQYSPIWPELIIKYIHHRMSCVFGESVIIFDQIISAFKIDNKIIEINRTTHKKTYNDLIQCTMIPRTTEICFIDNTGYGSMKCDRVYYIQPRPYNHKMCGSQIIERFLTMTNIVSQLGDFDSIIISLYNRFHKRVSENGNDNMETDLIVSQKMMYYIKEFFYMRYVKKPYTKKIQLRIGRFTRKKK